MEQYIFFSDSQYFQYLHEQYNPKWEGRAGMRDN